MGRMSVNTELVNHSTSTFFQSLERVIANRRSREPREIQQ
jgi:hypothetical protein